MGRGQISPEFRLAIDCCRRCFRGSGEIGLAPVNVDWSKFLALTAFHRIQGLANQALSAADAVPPATRATLQGEAAKVLAANLRSKAESRRLLEGFHAAGIEVIFLKGLSLSALGYGDPLLKSGIDIDLLIRLPDLTAAASVLRDLGYELCVPRSTSSEATLHRWHRGSKESVWVRRTPPLQVDLHTRTADNRHLIPHIEARSPRQWVDIGDEIRLPTLAVDELFAYLAVHGASSAWFRLKWISDVAALLHGCSPPEIERLYDRSQELGAGRSAGQSLLLADLLFGSLKHNLALAERLRSDAGTNLLFKAALRMLLRGPLEPTERPFGTFLIHATQLLLLPGARYAASELARQASWQVRRNRF
jgi:hypothetical protein